MTSSVNHVLFPIQQLMTVNRAYGQERVYRDKVSALIHAFGLHNETIPRFDHVEPLCRFIADFVRRTTPRSQLGFLGQQAPDRFSHVRDIALRENRLIYMPNPVLDRIVVSGNTGSDCLNMFVVTKEQVRLAPENLPSSFGSVAGIPVASYSRDYAADSETYTHHGVMLMEFSEADALEPLVDLPILRMVGSSMGQVMHEQGFEFGRWP